MSHDVSNEEDEIFCGKFTLREIKKVLTFDHRQTFTCGQSNSILEESDQSLKLIETRSEPDITPSTDSLLEDSHVILQTGNISANDSFIKMEQMVDHQQPFTCGQSNSILEESDQSLKLIETRSEPDIAPSTDSLLEDSHVTLQTGNISANDSFIKMEQMVELSMPSNVNEERDNEQLDNTLEEIDFILTHGHAQKPHNGDIQHAIYLVTDVDEKEVKLNVPENNCGTPPESVELECYNPVSPPTSSYLTPLKHNMKEHEALSTPSIEHKIKTPTFKTPANVAPTKKVLPGSATTRTPLKSNAYQHISSPIAAYIKNGPQVPLVRDVRPNKPLPGPSSIPKFVKSHSQKENVILPSVAYRSAKKTQMLDAPCEEKLPKCQFAKKLVSSLPRPVVIKHNHRENNICKKVLYSRQEDSFANLSLHQADVSVCTQKSAFVRPKKNL